MEKVRARIYLNADFGLGLQVDGHIVAVHSWGVELEPMAEQKDSFSHRWIPWGSIHYIGELPSA